MESATWPMKHIGRSMLSLHAPVNWWLQKHIDKGREEGNLSN